ncbi:MAG: hypothetical protein V3R81_15810, partial [Gammaproteobacteria bacterium]
IANATVAILPLKLSGSIRTIEYQGQTIPGLVVRTDGFKLGEAEICYGCTGGANQGTNTDPNAEPDAPIKIGSILEFDDIRVGIGNFEVKFGDPLATFTDFDGYIYIASGGAKFFPGKPITAEISDRPGVETDADNHNNTEAMRATLSFTDGKVDSFKFDVDTFKIQFGTFLTIKAVGFKLDTGAAGDATKEVVSFVSIGAEVKAGPLKIGGEMRNFAFMGDGSFQTRTGFGVFLSVDSANGDSVGWPSWLPVRITTIGITWKDINNKPFEFKLLLSASVVSIAGMPKNVKFSGSIEGVEIDLGLLFQGKFPITRIDSIGVSIKGPLFGGEINAGLIGGILRLDDAGNMIPTTNDTIPVAARVFFLGVEGGFEMSSMGLYIRFAMSELGPLGVLITASSPSPIVIDPIAGSIALQGFAGGVEFFKSLPSATTPEDLLAPAFTPALNNPSPDSDTWLAEVKQQVVTQYKSMKDMPPGAGFLAAFTEPMLIRAGVSMVCTYVPKNIMFITGEVQLATDGKLSLAGDLVFLEGLFVIPVRLFVDISNIGKGEFVMLFIADNIPVTAQGPYPIPIGLLRIMGGFKMGLKNLDGTVIDFDEYLPGGLETSILPEAVLVSPAAGDNIGPSAFNDRKYIDVTYIAYDGNAIDSASILDADPEFALTLPDGTIVNVDGTPLSAVDLPGELGEGVYRYLLPDSLTGEPGEYQINYIAGSWQDDAATPNTNEAGTVSFDVVVPTADLVSPKPDGRIDRTLINLAGEIIVRYRTMPGTVLDESTIMDGLPEFALSGAGAAGVSVVDDPVAVEGQPNTYRYAVTGDFSPGVVELLFEEGAYGDKIDDNNDDDSDDVIGSTNQEEILTFTVTGPTAALYDPSNGSGIDIVRLNSRGFIDIRY